MAQQQIADHVVTHTQRARLQPAAQAHRKATDRRPPHPVHGQLGIQVFHPVQGTRNHPGQRPRRHAGDQATDQGQQIGRRRLQRKQRPAFQQQRPQRGGNAAGNRHGQQAARTQFEQQQFNRQQHGRDGCAEHRRHARHRTRHQQGFALAAGDVEELAGQRTQRTSSHDDRPFGPKRPATADRHARCNRLEHGDLG